jgi:hypothetical protein
MALLFSHVDRRQLDLEFSQRALVVNDAAIHTASEHPGQRAHLLAEVHSI